MVIQKKKKSLDEYIKEETGGFRTLRQYEFYIVAIIGITWAIYQLALPSFLIIDTTTERAIHLAFAMALIFLLNPCLKKKPKYLGFLNVTDRIPLIDYILAALGVCTALYLFFDYEGIAMRMGSPLARDVVAGIILVLLLLEATRRIIGPALSIIATIFTAYAFLGPHMPELFAFKGVSITRYISNITLSTEGIYGIPLGVSASIVYLFVCFGALLDKAGAGKFFTDLALSFLGRFKGGAAKAAVVASGATGVVSGSSIANIVTTGPFTIPLMKKTGYPSKKAAAIEVAASTDGQLMPPIMGAAAFIIAEYVNVPYLDVVKAAAIPAFASYFGLFCITHLEASKLGIEGVPPEELPPFWDTLKNGIHYLIPLAMLLYQLVFLRHSPELAAYRSIQILILIIFYQEIRKAIIQKKSFIAAIKNSFMLILNGLLQGSKNMMPVALACASAGIIVGVVNMGIGGMIAGWVESISGGNIFLLLLITAFASLIIGMGLPTTATYIVMASLTAPIIVEIGSLYDFIIPIMAAHLFCFYFGILADDTPPVGLAAYAASAIAESEPIPTGIQGFLYDIRTSCIAFLFIFNPELILHDINNWPQALLIFGMCMIGMSAFESFAQGWCLVRNKWYDIPFFLVAWFILLHPGIMTSILQINHIHKYYFFLMGLFVYGIVISNQFLRKRTAKQVEKPSTLI